MVKRCMITGVVEALFVYRARLIGIFWGLCCAYLLETFFNSPRAKYHKIQSARNDQEQFEYWHDLYHFWNSWCFLKCSFFVRYQTLAVSNCLISGRPTGVWVVDSAEVRTQNYHHHGTYSWFFQVYHIHEKYWVSIPQIEWFIKFSSFPPFFGRRCTKHVLIETS